MRRTCVTLNCFNFTCFPDFCSLFKLQRLVSMEKKHDHVQGDRYLLEMELEMESESSHLARKRRVAEYVFVPRLRGQTRARGFTRAGAKSIETGELLLFKPKGFQWQPRKTVHFLVPGKNAISSSSMYSSLNKNVHRQWQNNWKTTVQLQLFLWSLVYLWLFGFYGR